MRLRSSKYGFVRTATLQSEHGGSGVDRRAAGGLSSGFDEREPAKSKLTDIGRLVDGRYFDREIIVLCVR